jgi:hypothetical protein
MQLWETMRRVLGVASAPEKIAAAAFRNSHPAEPVAWTRLAAEENGRFVVGVFYGSTRPPRFRFYEVAKATMRARELNDDEDYRPKQWR